MTYQETAYQKFIPVDPSGNVIGASGGGGGDATAANQAAQITLETAIRDRLPSALVGDRLKTDGSGVTQPISAVNLPLAPNAATDTMLQQVRDAIKAQIAIASTIWTDNSGAFYVRRDIVNESAGTISTVFTDPLGTTTTTTGSGLRPLSTVDKDTVTDFYDVITSGTGYSVGNLLASVTIIDVNSGTPTATFVWLNISLNTILATAPIGANIERANENIGAKQVGTWAVALSSVDATSLLNLSNAIGTPITGAAMPAGGAGWFGWLSGIFNFVSRIPSQGAALVAGSIPVALATDGVFATFAGLASDAASITGSIHAKLRAIASTLALDSSLQSILTAIPSTTKPVLVGNISNKFHEDFDGSALKSAVWNVVQTGAGQTITVTNSELQIVGGTTANSQTIIRSLVGFTIPLEVNWIFYLSQTIINREIYFELIDSTGVNVARAYFNSSSNFNSNIQTINNNTSGNAASVSTTYVLTTYSQARWEINQERVDFSFGVPNASYSFTNYASQTRFVPDPNQTYYLQIRFNNLATAPVSSTTLFIDAISVKAINEFSVQVNNGRGSSNPAQAIPANIVNTTVTLPVSVSGSAQTLDYFSSTTIQTSTPLVAGATFSGTATNTANQRNYIRGWVFTDQPGTLTIEQSTDNIIFRPTYSLNILASTTPTLYEHKIITQYFRFKFTNTGSVAQTAMQLINTQFNG